MSLTESFSYVPAALLGWIHQLSDEHQGYAVLGQASSWMAVWSAGEFPSATGMGASKKQVDAVEYGPPYLWL